MRYYTQNVNNNGREDESNDPRSDFHCNFRSNFCMRLVFIDVFYIQSWCNIYKRTCILRHAKRFWWFKLFYLLFLLIVFLFLKSVLGPMYRFFDTVLYHNNYSTLSKQISM